MNIAQLPSTWRMATLDEVAADIPNAIVDGPFGSNLKVTDYVDEGIPVLQGKNITGDEFTWRDVRYLPERKANELKRSSVRKGDVLLIKIGSIGYSAIIDDLKGFDYAIIPANLAKVTPNPLLIVTKYLHHWLRTTSAKNYFQGAASKTAQPALSLSKIRALPIPLPPLEEQRRIASILDAADSLRANRRAALAKLDQLAQSIFIDMFGDPVTNSKCWRSDVTLGEIAEIASGITKGRKLNGQPVREIPYLAVLNVQDRRLNLDVIKSIEATEKEINRFRLMNDDLLLTEGGDPDKLGRGTLWNNELPECIHQNHVFRVRLKSVEISPLFLNWLIGSPRGKKYFLRSAKQTTGIASINMTQLRDFPMLMPPVDLQQEFSQRIDAVDKTRRNTVTSAYAFEKLFFSLQDRAFRGEL